MASESILSYLRYRIVNRITGAEIVSNLPHKHQSTWTVRAMQPGAPGANAIGDFKIPLHGPGTEGFYANAAIYNLLLPGVGEGYRVEGFYGDGGVQSTPAFAGIITHVTWSLGGLFELSGYTDIWVANQQRPFPGEVHTSGQTTSGMAREYLGINRMVFSDQFNPFTSGNYTSSNIPGKTSGTWTGTTDANGVNSNVVSCSTGSEAVLISKTAQSVGADANTMFYVECLARISTNSTNANAGSVGIGFSQANTDANNSIVALAQAVYNSGRYDITVFVSNYAGGVLNQTATQAAFLTTTDDGNGFITLQLQLWCTAARTRFTVNGSTFNADTVLGGASANSNYPFLQYGTPGAGTTTGYFTNFLAGNRMTYGSAGGNASPFQGRNFNADTNYIPGGLGISPTFLEEWTAMANAVGMYWRYSPVTMATGTNPTMGNVDIQTQPGTDLSTTIRFVEDENLADLTQEGNGDVFGSDLQFNNTATASHGGINYARNIPAISTYGWLSGVGMSMTVSDYAGMARLGGKVATNKGTPGASYKAIVNRDPVTAGVFRELDYVTIHAPSLQINNLKLLVLAYTFTEGQATQELTLGQYSAGDRLNLTRALPGLNQIAGLFKSR